jgi:hypothetical protein
MVTSFTVNIVDGNRVEPMDNEVKLDGNITDNISRHPAYVGTRG